MGRNLKMPWSMKDTIENMEHVRDIMIKKIRCINLDGKAEEDVKEVNFDFNRVKNALEKQAAKKLDYEGDAVDEDGDIIYDTWICPRCHKRFELDYDDYRYCPECGQKIDWNSDIKN